MDKSEVDIVASVSMSVLLSAVVTGISLVGSLMKILTAVIGAMTVGTLDSDVVSDESNESWVVAALNVISVDKS